VAKLYFIRYVSLKKVNEKCKTLTNNEIKLLINVKIEKRVSFSIIFR